MNRHVRDALPDHASEVDDRGLPIDQVGIRDLRWPVQVLDRSQTTQGTVATLDISVGLPADRKGTHMSRIVECLEASGGEMSLRTLPDLLSLLQRRLDADEVYLNAEFPYFVRKKAPVSGVASWLDTKATFEAKKTGNELDFTLHVAVPVTSLCPCSKAISEYGAHNQRSTVTATVRGRKMVWIEDVIDAVEAAASSPVWALLKREDEKYVTELAYDQPRFVEDLVRETVLSLRGIPGVDYVQVVADNQESIHNHSAWARLTWPAADETPAQEPRPTAVPTDRESAPAPFGEWLRAHRTHLRLSQQHLAQQLGVSSSWISKVESGEKCLSAESLDRLAQVLGLDATAVMLRAGVVPEDLRSRIAADPESFLAWARQA
ncbi:MAG: GTP cyclohydrolase FolE2 [Myxococcota bacterium]